METSYDASVSNLEMFLSQVLLCSILITLNEGYSVFIS